MLFEMFRLKDGQALARDNYRIKHKGDLLIIRGATEDDAGTYTVILTNKITKHEQKRSFELRVNGRYSLPLQYFCLNTESYSTVNKSLLSHRSLSFLKCFIGIFTQ